MSTLEEEVVITTTNGIFVGFTVNPKTGKPCRLGDINQDSEAMIIRGHLQSRPGDYTRDWVIAAQHIVAVGAADMSYDD